METQTQRKKINRLSQTEIPRATLKDVVGLAEALRDNFAGRNATPIDLAQSLDRSPTSSGWRFLTGAAVAYGLTDNGYSSSSISLTPLGRQIVAPTEEGLETKGLISALLRPVILKSFYEKYDKNKFPNDDIAKNVLENLGVPKDRTDEALKIVIQNAEYVGILTNVSGNKYIQLDSAKFTGATEKLNWKIAGEPSSLKIPTGHELIDIAEGRLRIEIPSELKTKIFNDPITATDWHTAIKELITFAKEQFPEKSEKKEASVKKETLAGNAGG